MTTNIRTCTSHCLLALAAASVTIGCADDAPTCYDDLPDLDGDGLMSEADCDLVGVAAVMRDLCWYGEQRDMPSILLLSSEACRGFEEQVVDTRTHGSVRSAQGALQVAYQRENSGGADLILMQDRNGDGRLDDEQRARFAVLPEFTPYRPIVDVLLTSNDGHGAPAVIFVDWPVLTMWHDRDDDGEAAATEMVQIAAIDDHTHNFAMLTRDKILHVAFKAGPSAFGIWWDRNGNFLPDSGEIQTYAGDLWGIAADGIQIRLQMVIPGAGLAVTRALDLDGDGRFDDFSPTGEYCEGVLLGAFGSGLLCTDSMGSDPLPSPMLAFQPGYGHFIFNSGVWVDLNTNRRVDAAELLPVPHAGEPSFLNFSSSPAVAYRYADGSWPPASVLYEGMFDAQPQLRIRTYVERDRLRYLGEECDGDAICAQTLECTISGNAPEARCVPPLTNN